MGQRAKPAPAWSAASCRWTRPEKRSAASGRRHYHYAEAGAFRRRSRKQSAGWLR
jgi:hypothetical protein